MIFKKGKNCKKVTKINCWLVLQSQLRQLQTSSLAREQQPELSRPHPLHTRNMLCRVTVPRHSLPPTYRHTCWTHSNCFRGPRGSELVASKEITPSVKHRDLTLGDQPFV